MRRIRGVVTEALLRPLVHPLIVLFVGALVAHTSVFAVDAHAQTLFAPQDTSPNFASYHYLEECEVAGIRMDDELVVRKNPVWTDTMSASMQDRYETMQAKSRRPDSAIKAATLCLQRFKPDTVTIHNLWHAQYILKVLLIAHRDDDARRFVLKMLDSVRRQSEWKLRDALATALEAYATAQPVRLEDARRIYAEQLNLLKDDSLKYSLLASYRMAGAARYYGDTVLFKEVAWHAIHTLDAIPAKEHQRQFSGPLLASFANLLRALIADEGYDSLAISTSAYHMWIANAINARIQGTDPVKESTVNIQDTVPDLVGQHYYVAAANSQGAATGTTSPGLAAYKKEGALPPHEIPVRGHVNIVWFLPAFCHAEGTYREVETRNGHAKVPWQCAPEYAMLRRMKQRFPELEITLMSWTYGTVGQVGPLKPAEEADTLAKWWLGWQHIPARLVVEETPFFHVPDPDGRRVDFPTAYGDSINRLRKGWIPLIDQSGVSVEGIDRFARRFEAEENLRLIEVLIRRGRK